MNQKLVEAVKAASSEAFRRSTVESSSIWNEEIFIAALRDQGYVVPIEPTEEMVLAAMKVKDSSGIGRCVKHINIHERYKAMTAAYREDGE